MDTHVVRIICAVALALVILGADGGTDGGEADGGAFPNPGTDSGAATDAGGDGGWIEGHYRAEGCSCDLAGADHPRRTSAPIFLLGLL